MSHPKFFVGIDFGHGETSVSRVPGTNAQKVSRVPLRISGDFSDQKVFSAICRSSNGEWQFVWSKDDLKRPDVMEGFKGMINKLPSAKREALREFAKLVFKTILENDTELKYDHKTGEANFVICIANPSDWRRQSPNNPKEYLAFFQNEAGIKPAKMCINESDAAFYTKFDDYSPSDKVFVIDLGSSTIDFTTYHNSVCIHECCWGHNLGAHLVEDKLVEYGYTSAEEKEANIANMLVVTEQRKALHLGQAESALSLAARFEKEPYFTRVKNGPTMYNLEVKVRDLVPNWPKKSESAFTVIIDSSDVEVIIKDYILDLKLALSNAVKKLESYGISPNKVLLSGGASRMPFVKELTMQAFPKAEVIRDNFPEWVVSDGAARYAEVHTHALEQAETLKNTFTNWANSNLIGVIKDAGLKAFQETLRELMKEELDSKFRSNELDNKLTHFESVLQGILNSVTSSYKFKSRADKKFTDSVNSQIESQLKSIIKAQYGKVVSISTSFVDPKDNFADVPVETNHLHETVEAIAYNLFCGGIFDNDVNWKKNRFRHERDQLVDSAIQIIPETYEYEFSGDITDMINEAVAKIDEVLISNGLFSVSM